jgi:hypothetical protein
MRRCVTDGIVGNFPQLYQLQELMEHLLGCVWEGPKHLQIQKIAPL